MPKARINIRLKPTVLDAQGAVVKSALHNLGFESVQDVHVGRYIELDLRDGVTPEEQEAQVREMCQKLLANPIIEQYSVTLSAEA